MTFSRFKTRLDKEHTVAYIEDLACFHLNHLNILTKNESHMHSKDMKGKFSNTNTSMFQSLLVLMVMMQELLVCED